MRRAQPWRTNRARTLRVNDTSAEAKLWSRLRNRNLGGYKFVRQAPISTYFVDFLCRETQVVVEVDGATHGSELERDADAIRERELLVMGYRVVRVTNDDVFANLDGVLEAVLAQLTAPVD